MYKSVRLAIYVILIGILASTLVLSMSTDRRPGSEESPYYSALAQAAIPGALAQENSCPHTVCRINPHGVEQCGPGPAATVCDPSSCETLLCP